jgi:ATP-dependent RNA helicase SUPV3L1/SUV3
MWVGDGRIAVYPDGLNKIKPTTFRFDPAVVEQIRPMIDQWRRDDLRSKSTRRAEYRAKIEQEKFERHQLLKEVFGYENYPALFPLARSLQRKLVFLVGPTNSGKTYQALQYASKAETCEMLSPLRLLAMEHFEAFVSMGKRAAMVTGEEVVFPDDATHCSRTVEMTDFSRVVDVAIIDEIQMIHDQSRGWAWTAAAFGVPSRLVVMTGSKAALPLVERMAKLTGETLEIVELERKSPLFPMTEKIELVDVKKGDAIIVFSRQDAHTCQFLLGQLGAVSSAMIYGALGPDVRKAEAKRFTSGEADVLIATDAIGMGLNLGPIQRVLFASTEKFDGYDMRDLEEDEVRQIGGRAGRFGHSEVGYVGCLNFPGLRSKQKLIGWAIEDESDPVDGPFLLRPDERIVARVSGMIGSKRLADILHYIANWIGGGITHFSLSDLSEVRETAHMIDDLNLSLADKFALCCSPLNRKSENCVSLLMKAANAMQTGKRVAVPKMDGTFDMETLEDNARMLTLYSWLSYRFPGVMFQGETARKHLRTVQADTHSWLKQSGAKRAAKTLEQMKKVMNQRFELQEAAERRWHRWENARSRP